MSNDKAKEEAMVDDVLASSTNGDDTMKETTVVRKVGLDVEKAVGDTNGGDTKGDDAGGRRYAGRLLGTRSCLTSCTTSASQIAGASSGAERAAPLSRQGERCGAGG